MKVLFVYPRFQRHAEANPELHDIVPMNEYVGYLRLWREFYADRREEFAAMSVAERTIHF